MTAICRARLDISSLVQPGKNTLEILFSPVKEALKKAEEKYSSVLAEKMVDSCRFLRKTFHDFTTYLGNDPDFYKVGVFGKVILFEIPDRLQIDGMDVEYSLNETLDTAKVQIDPMLSGEKKAGSDELMQVKILYGREMIWEQEKSAGCCFEAVLENVHPAVARRLRQAESVSGSGGTHKRRAGPGYVSKIHWLQEGHGTGNAGFPDQRQNGEAMGR